MEGLKLIPYIALVLTIGGLITGAMVLTTNTFKDTLNADECWNASFSSTDTRDCENTTVDLSVAAGCCGEDGLNYSGAGYALFNSVDAQGTVAEQQPTLAIISVMVIIISIIAGVFVYMKYFA